MRTNGAIARAGCGFVLVAVLSACTTAVPGSATPAERSGPPDDADLADVVLQPADLPPGWVPGQEVDFFAGGALSTFTNCLGASPPAEGRLGVNASPRFSDVQETYIFSAVSSYRSEERVEADSTLFSDPRATDCFTEVVFTDAAAAGFGPDYTMLPPQVTVTPADGEGPDALVATVVTILPLGLPDGGQTVFYTEYAFLVGRWTEAVVAFSTVDARADDALRQRVVAAVAARVEDL